MAGYIAFAQGRMVVKLSGRKAIVTGANRGIGRAIALAFAREGADVVISYRSDREGAEKVAESISSLGRRGVAIHADFSEIEGVEDFFGKALHFLGSVDLLVNNAAEYNTRAFLDLQARDFERLMKVNVLAPMLLSQLAVKQMIDNVHRGSVINISAITGERAYPNRVAHSAAKAALNMMTKSMALELKRYSIRVNAISPGSTSDVPEEGVGRPEDQAKAAVFLASEDASRVTGVVLTVDAGQSLSFHL